MRSASLERLAQRNRFVRLYLSAGSILLAIGLAGFIRYSFMLPMGRPAALIATTTPLVLLPSQTSTPFRPLSPTATQVPTATPTPTPTPVPPSPILAGEAANRSETISLVIHPSGGLNAGKDIRISFVPSNDCPFGNQRACLSLHRGGTLTLLTIHSGVGGQGESFRKLVEGLGVNSAGYSLDRIQANLNALEGVAAALQVDGGETKDLELIGVARIPPFDLEQYFALPVDQALEIAAFYQPAFEAALESGEPLLAFEICGWMLPGEEWAPGASSTTGSIYLGLLRER